MSSDYHKYRTPLPPVFAQTIAKTVGMRRHHTVAEIGAGTGLFTQSLIGRCKKVYAIEPNRTHRKVFETNYKGASNLVLMSTNAERTNLRANSIDFIFAARAFRNFNPFLSQVEWKRICKKRARVALVESTWPQKNPFMLDYRKLLEDNGVEIANLENNEKLKFYAEILFSGEKYKLLTLGETRDDLSFEGLLGREHSSPHGRLIRKRLFKNSLKKIFGKHQENGTIGFVQKHCLIYGPI